MKVQSGKSRIWIVVADGAKARFFLDHGTGEAHPVPIGEMEGDNRPTREIGAERPGRTHESANAARHAYAPRVDWHEFEKHLFAKRVADLIASAHLRHEFDELVLVAPPRTLGELRQALPEAVHRVIRAEAHKDLTGLAEPELLRRVGELAASHPGTLDTHPRADDGS
jgi:protein required for attachment to host cells